VSLLKILAIVICEFTEWGLQKAESARFFARFLPVFLLKKRPLFGRFFFKLSPFEEIATLQLALC